MSTATLYIGDVFDVMAKMPDNSVDLVLTSPPFLALRSYLPADHPDKAKEIGSEPTPAEFLDTLLALTAEWGRLIGPYGSIAVELGDTYSGSGGAGGDYAEGGMRQGQNGFTGSSARSKHEQPRQWSGGSGWPLPKSLCGIPHLYHLSLAYGRNILTGEDSPAGRWRVRNVVAWCRPNPPVGALADKVRPATSYITIATRATDRWFDLDAIRVEHKKPDGYTRARRADEKHDSLSRRSTMANYEQHPDGGPPLDHWWFDDEFWQDAWEVSTEAYPGSHYATWPRKLLDRPVKAMCPLQVCAECGEPRRRIVERTQVPTRSTNGRKTYPDRGSMCENFEQRTESSTETLGWTDCGHDSYRRGVVLDPFAGSGTTLAVATGHGRTAIGIDIDERNEHLIRERVGMFLSDVIDTRSPLLTDTKGAA